MPIFYLVFLFLLVSNAAAFAQNAGWEKALDHFLEKKQPEKNATRLPPEAPPAPAPCRVPLPEWQPAQLPVFCRLEYAVQQKTRVPLFFRLGSLDYVNFLEQKPGYGH